MSMAAGDFPPGGDAHRAPAGRMPRTGSRSRRPPSRVQWLMVPNSVSTTRVAGAGLLRDPPLSSYRASGASISRAAARIEKCPWPG